MSKFMDDIKKDMQDNIRYKNTVMTGEITAVNDDGTYDVKIAQSGNAYPDVETMSYSSFFSVGEIVDIAFEYGNRELPKIMGTAKKIAQEPAEVEVDYSGSGDDDTEGGGEVTETDTIYSPSSIADGTVYKMDADYDTAHDGASGDAIESGADYIVIGYGYANFGGAGWKHNIIRSFFFFDTSSIPENAVITSAKLSIYKESIDADTAFDLVVQNGQPTYPHNPLVVGDYNKTHYSNNGGSINTDNLNTGAYSEITLNSNGRAWINKGGTTKFCIRSSREIAGLGHDTPEDEHLEAVGIYTAEKGGDYRPKLEITYEY